MCKRSIVIPTNKSIIAVIIAYLVCSAATPKSTCENFHTRIDTYA